MGASRAIPKVPSQAFSPNGASGSFTATECRFDEHESSIDDGSGSYRVRVSAPGKAGYLTHVDLEVGRRIELSLPVLEPLPGAGSPSASARVRAASSLAPAEQPLAHSLHQHERQPHMG